MYKPLPKCLTIKKSPIEGLGLYATENIKANTFLGITHILDENFENNYIRTPLGGFYNHSNNPNIRRVVSNILPKYNCCNDTLIEEVAKKLRKAKVTGSILPNVFSLGLESAPILYLSIINLHVL